MPDGDAEEARVAGLLLDAIAALREGRLDAAAHGLGEVAAALDGQAELADVRLRALCLLTDAHLKAGRPDEAHAALDAARALSEAADAAAGPGGGAGSAEALAELAGRLTEAREAAATAARAAREAAALRGWSVAQLRDRYGRDPRQLAEVLVKKANAEIDVGDPSGAALAAEALEVARSVGDVRAEVLAWVSVARADPARAAEALEAAWRRAERADEFTLVGLVARAAELQGVALPAMVGPGLTRGGT